MTQSDFWWSILIRTSKNSSLRKSQEIFVSIDENLSFPSASPIVYTMCQFHNLFRIFFLRYHHHHLKNFYSEIYIFTFCILINYNISCKKWNIKIILLDRMTKKGWRGVILIRHPWYCLFERYLILILKLFSLI